MMEQRLKLVQRMEGRRIRCAVCGGHGVIKVYSVAYRIGETPATRPGQEFTDPCPVCDGTGWLIPEEVEE